MKLLAQWVDHRGIIFLCQLNKWMNNLHYPYKNLEMGTFFAWLGKDQWDKRINSRILPLPCCYSFSFSLVVSFPPFLDWASWNQREKVTDQQKGTNRNGIVNCAFLSCSTRALVHLVSHHRSSSKMTSIFILVANNF